MGAGAQQQRAGGGRDRFEDYVPVAERLEKFYDRFPDGRVVTQIVEHDQEAGFVLIRAEVYRSPDDAQAAATGHAFEVRGESYVNKSSYVENCETSSVGRALAMLGFEIKRGVASREEIEKTARMTPNTRPRAAGDDKSAHLQEVKPEAGDRRQLLTRCGELFREMNRLGYKPEWTKARIDIYVNGMFTVKRGTDDLSEVQLRKLVADLEHKREPEDVRRVLRACTATGEAYPVADLTRQVAHTGVTLDQAIRGFFETGVMPG